MKRALLTITGILFLLTADLDAQLTPAEAVAQMGRGINLGNTLEPPQEGGWNNPEAQESYFDTYVEAGFKTVRIPVTWDKHVGTSSPYTVDEDWLDRVEEVVEWGLSRDMFVIINAHHEGWLKENFDQQETRDRFDSIWSQISIHFKGKSEKLFFEMLNEPRTHTHEGLTQTQIDDMNARVLGIIRKDHPTRIVVYSGKGWSSSSDMMAAAIPDDPYIMAYFHSYNPWDFAGDGNGTWGSKSDRDAIYNQFRQVKSWADENGLQVLLGETGAVEECDYNSRMIHYATYVRACLDNNIISAVWDDGGRFEVLHRSDLSWNDSKDILIHGTLKSPDNISLTPVDESSIQVEWTNRSEDYDTIKIERRFNNGEFIPMGGVSPQMNSWVDSSAQAKNDYYYRVIATQDGLDSYSYPVKHFLIPYLPTVKVPYTSEFCAIPGSVEAENYDYGGEDVSYHESTVENVTGSYRPNEGVDIEEANDGGYLVGNVSRGEWIDYCVDVAEAGPYRITIPVASPDGGGIFRILFSGHVAATITVPETGSFETMEDLNVHVNLDAGEQLMKILIMKLPPFTLDKFFFSSAVGQAQLEVEGFTLYPNPAGDVVSISAGEIFSEGTVRIYSTEGLLVKQVDQVSAEQELDISQLAPGAYLIQLESQNGLVNRRLLKQ